MHILFLRIFKNKSFSDNVVQAFSSFKEGYRGLLKLDVHLGEGILVLKKKEGIFFEVEEKRIGRLSKSIEISCLMAL